MERQEKLLAKDFSATAKIAVNLIRLAFGFRKKLRRRRRSCLLILSNETAKQASQQFALASHCGGREEDVSDSN
jgi:hypothetical protein